MSNVVTILGGQFFVMFTQAQAKDAIEYSQDETSQTLTLPYTTLGVNNPYETLTIKTSVKDDKVTVTETTLLDKEGVGRKAELEPNPTQLMQSIYNDNKVQA